MKILAVFFLLFAVLIEGCGNEMKTEDSANTYKGVQTELGFLPKLINLPKAPLSVKWEVIEDEGRDTGRLFALLGFTEGDYDGIVKACPPFEAGGADSLSPELFERWVPEALKNRLNTKKNGGRIELLNVRRLKPDLFVDPGRSPFVNGRVLPLGDGYLFIHLHSM